MILDKHYWWTNDRERVVPDGHPDAAFLAFAKGHEIADALAAKYGIGSSKRRGKAADDDAGGPDAGDDDKGAGDAKAKPAPANKAGGKAADKAGG